MGRDRLGVPDTDLIFAGTGNSSPWYDEIRGKGDSLYTAAIIALHASNGEMAWYTSGAER